jgi:hypothetical protein
MQDFFRKTRRKEPLGRPRSRWEYNIRIIFEIWGRKLWTQFMWLRKGDQWLAVVNTLMNSDFHKRWGIFDWMSNY